MAAPLKGIFTPTLVPFDERGMVNEGELRRFVNWLIERGVDGLYPNGSTGEFTRLTVEERRLIVRVTCEEARGRVPVLAGAAEANVKETLAACELYASYGARAVAIVSPFYYRLTPESLFAHFREIAQHSPIDITLYNIPMFASPIDVPTIRRLSELPRITGIKDSTGDVAIMMRMIAAIRPQRPEFTFLTGWDAVLVPMLVAGADGGTNAASNVVPELMRKLYDLARAGQLEAAMKLQYRILELFDEMLFPFEFPDGFRAGAELRGFRFGSSRLVQSSAQKVNRAALEKVLRCMLSDMGVVEAPAAGCAVRTGDSERDKVEQLVAEVLDSLRSKGML